MLTPAALWALLFVSNNFVICFLFFKDSLDNSVQFLVWGSLGMHDIVAVFEIMEQMYIYICNKCPFSEGSL